MSEQHDIDSVSGRSTTGHEWDGIKELNTPLPRWWVLTFYATILWAFALLDRLSGVAAGERIYDRSPALHQPCRRYQRSRRSRGDTRRQDEGTCRRLSCRYREGSERCFRWRARAARRCSPTTARRATARARPAPRAIRISTTMTGCGAVRWSRSVRRSSSGPGRAIRRRMRARCLPSAVMAC